MDSFRYNIVVQVVHSSYMDEHQDIAQILLYALLSIFFRICITDSCSEDLSFCIHLSDTEATHEDQCRS